MKYFSGIKFNTYKHIPNCTFQINNKNQTHYALNYAHEGELYFRYDKGKELMITGPVAWLTYPEHQFEFGVKEPNSWDHRFITFKGEKVSHYIQGGLFPIQQKAPIYPIFGSKLFCYDFNRLLTYLNSGLANPAQAIHQLEGLLLQLHQQQLVQLMQSPMHMKVSKLIRSITSQPERKWDFQVEIKKLHISNTHFRRLFKNITGLSPIKFLSSQRLNMASLLLVNTQLEVKVVATKVGIPDVFYFTKLFKQQFKVPPAKYKKQFHQLMG